MACKYLATVNSQVFNVLNVRENRGSSSITVYLRFLKHPIRTVVSERILKQRVNNPRKRTLQNLSQQPAETKKTRDLGIESRSQPFLSLSNFKPWCSSWPTSKGKRERGKERERGRETTADVTQLDREKRAERERGWEARNGARPRHLSSPFPLSNADGSAILSLSFSFNPWHDECSFVHALVRVTTTKPTRRLFRWSQSFSPLVPRPLTERNPLKDVQSLTEMRRRLRPRRDFELDWGFPAGYVR